MAGSDASAPAMTRTIGQPNPHLWPLFWTEDQQRYSQLVLRTQRAWILDGGVDRKQLQLPSRILCPSLMWLDCPSCRWTLISAMPAMVYSLGNHNVYTHGPWHPPRRQNYTHHTRIKTPAHLELSATILCTTQRAQNSSIKQYALNSIRIPNMI